MRTRDKDIVNRVRTRPTTCIAFTQIRTHTHTQTISCLYGAFSLFLGQCNKWCDDKQCQFHRRKCDRGAHWLGNGKVCMCSTFHNSIMQRIHTHIRYVKYDTYSRFSNISRWNLWRRFALFFFLHFFFLVSFFVSIVTISLCLKILITGSVCSRRFLVS